MGPYNPQQTINLKKERQATVGPSGDGLRWSCQLDLENGAWRYEKKGCPFSDSIMKNLD